MSIMRPHGVMFHHFHSPVHPPGQGSMGAEQLAELLGSLGTDRILPAAEFLERATAGKLRDDDLCLTFDDTLLCQYDVAVPVLQDLKLTAFFFCYTSVLTGGAERIEIFRHYRMTRFADVADFYQAFWRVLSTSRFAAEAEAALRAFVPRNYLAEFPFYTDDDRRFRFLRDDVLGPADYTELMDQMLQADGVDLQQAGRLLWMTPDRVRRLHKDGHVIGLHSHTHPTRLASLPPVDQANEYARNAASIRQITGGWPVAMSHPCNSYNPATLIILRELGLRIGFRSNMAPCDGGLLELPREDHTNLLARLPATRRAA